MDRLHLIVSACALAVAPAANATCGSAFCTINTDWNAQGAWTEQGARLDLRYEFIDQDQPRTGTRNVGIGEIPAHHDEIRTINRNYIGSFDYSFSPRWGMTVSLPVVSRSHTHIHNHMGAQLHEAWDFTEVGDARVTGRYRLLTESPEAGSFGIQFGLKLPTGEFKVTNADGDVAERSLQPGSGTTDMILGAFYQGNFSGRPAWFIEASAQTPMAERDGYKPGTRLGFNAGYSHGLTESAALLLQLNVAWKDRDSGREAEPEDSGGTFVYISPGASFRLGDKTQIYGFVQLPIYQRVNGVQLVADWSLVAGLSRRF